MATGWAQDGAVQEQMDATVSDAIARARQGLQIGESLSHCAECGSDIPPKRRAAISGVRLCVECQQELDGKQAVFSGYNRRGSKDSQLR
jgi:phage/conjugal plasmid C-4 type zinc finger TraR family protein